MGQSRSRLLAGDPARGNLVCWARRPVGPDWAGPLPRYTAGWYGEPTYQLLCQGNVSVPVQRRSTGRDRAWFDPTYHLEAAIPDGVKPGRCTLQAGPISFPIEVVPPPKRATLVKESVLNPGAGWDTIQAALYDQSTGVIRFNPGLYRIPKQLDLSRANGVTLIGPGAEIRYTGKVAEYANIFAGGCEWLVVDGLTFRSPDWVRPFQQDVFPYLTLLAVSFLDCGLNDPGPGLYAEGCEWVRGAAFLGRDGGLIRRCEWRDGRQDAYPTVWGANDNLAFVDCTFNRPDRGIVCQPRWGEIRGLLLLGLRTYDAGGAEGGSEGGLLSEGLYGDEPTVGLRDPLILHTRYRAGAGGGAALQLDEVATGGLVIDFKASGGYGLVLWGVDVEDWDFVGVELRDAGVILEHAKDCRFHGGAIVGFRPGAWNVSTPTADWFADRACVSWRQDHPPGSGGRFESFAFEGQAVTGPLVELVGCTFKGAIAVP